PLSFSLTLQRPPPSTLFPYTTLFRSFQFTFASSNTCKSPQFTFEVLSTLRSLQFTFAFDSTSISAQFTFPSDRLLIPSQFTFASDRKSTRLNSSHVKISYAVFCLKKK